MSKTPMERIEKLELIQRSLAIRVSGFELEVI